MSLAFNVLCLTLPAYYAHCMINSNRGLPFSLLQQTFCLVGSVNTQLFTLWRKKILASINKSKIDLATQPLPNAKNWLFDDDFPSIASKEAGLSRGLAKNLAPKAKLDKSKTTYGSRDSRYVTTSSNNSSTIPKNGKY